jgi:hypothetical protein
MLPKLAGTPESTGSLWKITGRLWKTVGRKPLNGGSNLPGCPRGKQKAHARRVRAVQCKTGDP